LFRDSRERQRFFFLFRLFTLALLAYLLPAINQLDGNSVLANFITANSGEQVFK